MTDLRQRYLLEPADLQARLSEPDLRVFDAAVTLEVADGGYRPRSGRADYEQAHVPGAGFLDLIVALADTSTGLGFSLPAADDLARRVGAAGIGNDTPVVLYSSGHLMWATRAFWLLHSLGHDQVQVLNGGLKGWQAAGYAVEAGSHTLTAQPFAAAPRPGAFVDLAQMQAVVAAGQQQTVCTLSTDLYAGTGDFHYGRRGHIPGSTHLPYDALLADGALLPAEPLRAALQAGGAAHMEPLVSHCGGGIAATVLAFARLISGCGETAVYDGSLSEWIKAGEPLREGMNP